MKRTRKPLGGLRLRSVTRPVAAAIAGAMIASIPIPAMAEAADGSDSDGSVWPDSEAVNEFFVSAVDVVVLRPGGFARLVVGGILLAPSTLFNVIALPLGQDTSVFKDDLDRFIMEPAEYTFSRSIGKDLLGG